MIICFHWREISETRRFFLLLLLCDFPNVNWLCDLCSWLMAIMIYGEFLRGLASNSRQLPSSFFCSLIVVCAVVNRMQFIMSFTVVELSRHLSHELWTILFFKGVKKSFNIYKTDTNQLEWFELNWVWHTSIGHDRAVIRSSGDCSAMCKWSHVVRSSTLFCELFARVQRNNWRCQVPRARAHSQLA